MLRRGKSGITDLMGIRENLIKVEIGMEQISILIFRIVIHQAIKNLLGFLDLLGEGEEGRVLGFYVTGELVFGVLQVEDLLELGDGLEELGLEGVEEGEDLFGGGGRGGEVGGGGGGGGWQKGGECTAIGSGPVGAIGGDIEETSSEGGHL